MAQLAVNRDFNIAFAGMKADAEFDKVISAIAEGEINFGLFITQGTKPTEQVKVPAAAETIEGVALHEHKEQSSPGAQDAKYLDKDEVSVLRQGEVWVPYATGVTPAIGDTVYANVDVANEEGRFHNAAGADNIAVPTAELRQIDTATGLVKIAINLP